ncbi:hypothetical protein NHP194003_16900 [Helicobacter suis]|uniref:Uncharacterized protein n=1 Tax=Helicobacter suis TaxID=104628 RepID=A0A510HDM1_9HELI|nr:hypothetical protein NHP190020_07160 [Helicobacter suis]BDR29032.1 hypothetical protein HSHS1_17930 [Helicobacter suis HS1]BCD46712.1 hypothetical protein NHP190020_17510 [Helicobacter suis]BCD47380.1 hypothetical protein NHP194003_05840 [Helicobacter suis]BCD48486.1 hypothetical protein NHP194003_16900 [Helicobacter suis]
MLKNLENLKGILDSNRIKYYEYTSIKYTKLRLSSETYPNISR